MQQVNLKSAALAGLRIAIDPVRDNRPMEQANETAIFASKHEKTEHIRATDIVAAEFEAGQREVQISAPFVDQIALVVTT